MKNSTDKNISGTDERSTFQSYQADLKGNFILQENKVESKVFLACATVLVGSVRTVFYLLLPEKNFSGPIDELVGTYRPTRWEDTKKIEAKILSLVMPTLRQPTAINHSLDTFKNMWPSNTQHKFIFLDPADNKAQQHLNPLVRQAVLKG